MRSHTPAHASWPPPLARVLYLRWLQWPEWEGPVSEVEAAAPAAEGTPRACSAILAQRSILQGTAPRVCPSPTPRLAPPKLGGWLLSIRVFMLVAARSHLHLVRVLAAVSLSACQPAEMLKPRQQRAVGTLAAQSSIEAACACQIVRN